MQLCESTYVSDICYEAVAPEIYWMIVLSFIWLEFDTDISPV